MVHQYITDTPVTLSRLAVGQYLDRRATDDWPMHRPYNVRYSTATQLLYRPIYQLTVDRGVDRYIGVNTPYKTQDPTFLGVSFIL